MKKNSKKVVIRKPKVGELYKIWAGNLDLCNIIKIERIANNFAFYTTLSDPFCQQRWNFIKFPEILDQKISSLEMELM